MAAASALVVVVHDGHVELTELADDLRAAATRLESIAAEGEADKIAEVARSATEACSRVAEAWSGSWFGYHSRVYYADFAPPPPGARFSSEWGFNQAFSNATRGDWREYRYEDVIASIEAIGGNHDLTPVEEYAKRARSSLDQERGTVISILSAALTLQDDTFVREGLDEAKALKPFTQSDVVRIQRPSGTLMSRDTAAMSAGLIAPAHIAYLGGIVEMTDPGRRCGELAKLANRMAEHLDRIGTSASLGAMKGSRVFIGHGGSPLWRELKDFLHDRLGLDWEEFNRVSPAGIGTTDRLGSMLDNASMAFLVCTAEDEHADGSRHARENVIHEAGLFQGRLGFQRAIVVLEEGCAEFSNIHGLGQIRFPKGNIAACFEEVRQVLEREGLVDSI